MSNKTQLQTNNTSLEALITRVNAAKETAASLPEAGGGGGSVETCTVTITFDSSLSNYENFGSGGYMGVFYASLNPLNSTVSIHVEVCESIAIGMSYTIKNVVKNSFIAISTSMVDPDDVCSIENIEEGSVGVSIDMGIYAMLIKQDSTITISYE